MWFLTDTFAGSVMMERCWFLTHFTIWLKMWWQWHPPSPKKASAWLLDVPQRCWEPTPTLDVCKAVSCCLSGKYSSDIHIFHSSVGSLLWRKSRHSNADRFASSSGSTCHVPRCLATGEMAFLSLSMWPYLVQWRAVLDCDWYKEPKSQLRSRCSLPSHQILKRLSNAN